MGTLRVSPSGTTPPADYQIATTLDLRTDRRSAVTIQVGVALTVAATIAVALLLDLPLDSGWTPGWPRS